MTKHATKANTTINKTHSLIDEILDAEEQKSHNKPRIKNPSISLLDGESVDILSKDGTPVVKLTMAPLGPQVQILTEDININLENKLRIEAKAIDFHARDGNVNVTSKDDVVVQGRTIYLN